MIDIPALRALVLAGVPASAIVDAVEASQKAELAVVEQRDRLRREKNAERMRAARASPCNAHTSTHAHTVHKKACDLTTTFLSSLTDKQAVVQQGKSGDCGTRRGTRLDEGQKIPLNDWQFAADFGLRAEEIDRLWAEFVDYWIGIPGQRGTKLNWSATWRNRVRAMHNKHTGSNGNGQHKQSLSDLAFELADEARERERAAGTFRPDESFGGD